MTTSVEDGLHVVVGASGGTGRVIVRELRAAGRRVRAVNRSWRLPPCRVEVVAADPTNAAQMRRACAGAAFVYNCVNPPFLRRRELFPAAVDGVLAGAAAADPVTHCRDHAGMSHGFRGRDRGPLRRHDDRRRFASASAVGPTTAGE